MTDGINIDTAYAIIIPTCLMGLFYALFNFLMVRRVNILSHSSNEI